jgi:hypothetical protein
MKFLLALVLLSFSLSARAEDWLQTLAETPFKKTHFQAYRTEPIELILKSFKPSDDLRAVVLMPAAADQLYFFDWGKIELPKHASLLDALNALTNKAHIRYSLAAPFLLIHMERDTISDPLLQIPAKKIEFEKHIKPKRLYSLDHPYDRLLPWLEKVTGMKASPDGKSTASWHWYRISFVGYDFNTVDLLRAFAYAMKTSVSVEGDQIIFKDRPFQL